MTYKRFGNLPAPDDQLTNCKNCAAPLPIGWMGMCRCEYCGTTYRRDDGIVRIVEERAGVIPIQVECRFPRHMLLSGMDIKKAVTKNIIEQISVFIADNVQLQYEDDLSFLSDDIIVRGRIRVLDNDFRF